MKIVFVFIVLISFNFLLFSDTYIPQGNVTGTWTLENSPYYIEGEITIQNNELLIIEPGVNIIFTGHYKFKIYGNLQAVGTINDSIHFTISDTTGFSNHCGWDGGWHGLRFYNTNNTNPTDTLRIIHCKIEYGKAISLNPDDGCGGAINCYNSSNILIQNSLISNNIANQNGGAICLNNNSNISIENVIIRDNLAQSGGGAIFIDNSSPHLKRVLITKNENLVWFGTIWLYNHSSPLFENVTIVNNESENSDNATFFLYDTCNLMIVNSIIRNNFSREIFCNGIGGFNIITICYTNLNDGEDGIDTNYNGYVNWLEGNIDSNPHFVDPENYNFQLQVQSPCIDSGIDFFEWNGNVIIDLEESEYHGPAPDMGCYEYGLTGIEDEIVLIQDFQLNNYPNPFNPSTTISFSIQEESKINLSIFNIKGQKVKTLTQNEFTKGSHSIIWNGDNDSDNSVSSGIYYYKLNVNGKTKAVKKCLLLK